MEENEKVAMDINVLRDNIMTYTSIRMTYADENEGNQEVKNLLDELTIKTLKKMKSLTAKVGQ